MLNESLNDKLITQVLAELKDIRNEISKLHLSNGVSEEWLSRSVVKSFLSYGDTQMATLEHSGLIVIAKVGKRKFFHKQSFLNFLEKNIITRTL